MTNTISVIIPVYNVERYLVQCLESVLNQSYNKLEIILIDDGSTDRSGEICDFYAKKDGRVRVIHQKNGGAASAKNAALRIATGEYLSFVDSDDYLVEDAYNYMVEQLEKNKADVIQCGFRNIYCDHFIECITLDSFVEFPKIDYLRRFTTDWTCGLLWDKLYRRKLFDGIWFEEGHKIDDEFFTYQGIMNADKIIYSPEIVYNYRKRKSSVMQQSESQQKIVMDKLDYLEKRRLKIVRTYPELKQEFDYHFLTMLVILSKDIAATRDSIRITQNMLKDYFSTGKSCKMDLSLRKQLFLLQRRTVDRILQSRNVDMGENEQNYYFE